MTIAQQLKITKFPFIIKDSKNHRIYYENSNGYWVKREYDSKGNEIYYENSNEYWEKREYDSKSNIIYYEDSNGYWSKRGYDNNSFGTTLDNRPKPVELTMDEIATKFGINVNNLKIKK